LNGCFNRNANFNAQSIYESEEYGPYLKTRLAGARNELTLVAGEDIAGLAQIA